MENKSKTRINISPPSSARPLKIAMLPKYHRDGSSSRLRLYQYAESEPFSTFTIDIFPLYGKNYIHQLYTQGNRSKSGILSAYLQRLFLLIRLFQYDILWIEKELFPRLPAIAEWILSTLGIRYIVDYDDATFHDYDHSRNRIIQLFLKHKIDHVMKYARCVVCGNRYIQAHAEKAGAKQTQLIPTVVDAQKYGTAPPKEHPLTIGWIGSPPTEKYLALVKAPLTKLLTQLNGRLLLVGTTEKIRQQFPDIPLTLATWDEDKEAEYLSQIDIGIMPLKDEPWERGKCGFKLLQYMAAGKPVVASPVGVNIEIVNHAQCGYLATTEDDWFRHLSQLAMNADLRKKLGTQGRNTIEQQYSLKTQSPKLANILLEHARHPDIATSPV